MNQKLCGPAIHDDGVTLVKQKFLCTCHHATRMDVVEQKILVNLSSRDDGVRLGTKNSCAPVIMDVVEQNNLVDLLSSHDEGGCLVTTFCHLFTSTSCPFSSFNFNMN